jgi:CDP-glucose 4,6-dehydratase
LGAETYGFALPPNTSPSHFELLRKSKNSVLGDIREIELIQQAIDSFRPEIVFHLAAQPLVRKSYANPIETFQVNIIGTVNLLESVRNSKSVKAIINVTTDKVYKITEGAQAFTEDARLGGHDPYSTSKACVELIHESYQKPFLSEKGIFSATARAGNVIGGGDWAEDRLIPDLVRAASSGRKAIIRNAHAIRPWQHVLEPLAGYLLLGQHLLEQNESAKGSWNFGPEIEDCLPVEQVIGKFGKDWPDMQWSNDAEIKSLHESSTLRLNCLKAKENLGWVPIWNLDQAVQKTANWYSSYYRDGKLNTEQDLRQYIARASDLSAIWTQ